MGKNANPTPVRMLSGKLYDPVFLCMIGALVLALGSSILLRTVMSNAGPSAAMGSEAQENPLQIPSPSRRPAGRPR